MAASDSEPSVKVSTLNKIIDHWQVQHDIAPTVSSRQALAGIIKDLRELVRRAS